MNLFGPPNVAKLQARGDVPRLIALLGTLDRHSTRWKAMEALAALGLAAVAPLRDTIAKHPDMAVRKLACLALGTIGDPVVAANLGHILSRLKPAYVPTVPGRREFDDDDLGRVDVDLEQILVRQLARFGDPVCLPYLRRHPEWGLGPLIPKLETRAAELRTAQEMRRIDNLMSSAMSADHDAVRELVDGGRAAVAVTEIVRRIAAIQDRSAEEGRRRAESMARAPVASGDFIPASSHASREETNYRLRLEASLALFGAAAREPLAALLAAPDSSASMRSIAEWHLGTLAR